MPAGRCQADTLLARFGCRSNHTAQLSEPSAAMTTAISQPVTTHIEQIQQPLISQRGRTQTEHEKLKKKSSNNQPFKTTMRWPKPLKRAYPKPNNPPRTQHTNQGSYKQTSCRTTTKQHREIQIHTEDIRMVPQIQKVCHEQMQQN